MTTLTAPPSLRITPERERHWTIEEFYEAYDAGKFGYTKQLELIQGRIIEKMPPGIRHSYLGDAVAHMLRTALEPRLVVREEKAVHLAFDSQLIPDISVVRGERSDYSTHHPVPEEVALLVEVADTSAEFDLGEKAIRYAESGIAEYWVVLVNEPTIICHRMPTPNGYGEVVHLAGADTISPLAAPETVWTVDTLLGQTKGTGL